jgi:hypothetical protein
MASAQPAATTSEPRWIAVLNAERRFHEENETGTEKTGIRGRPG